MVTLISEPQVIQVAQPRTVADYEVCKVPTHWRREPLKRASYRNVRTRQLIVPMPGWVWEKVWEAIPVFGMEQIYIYAPKEAWRGRRRVIDPLVVGRHGAKWHFIAAWNLENEIK